MTPMHGLSKSELTMTDSSSNTAFEWPFPQVVGGSAKKKADLPIPIPSRRHARYILTKMIEGASLSVMIYVETLPPRDPTIDPEADILAYEALLDVVERFMRKPEAKLTVLVQKGNVDDVSRHPITERLQELKRFERQWRIVLAEPDALYGFDDFFSVIDTNSYIYESQIADSRWEANSRWKAVANFGDTATALKLRESFQNMISFLDTSGRILGRWGRLGEPRQAKAV